MPPAGSRAGEILMVDSTVFSTLFGADDSLKRFWKNLATAQVRSAARLLAACVAPIACANDAFSQARRRSRDTIPQANRASEARLRRRAGSSYTNFSRFFSNLEIADASGEGVQSLDELRYANISMLTWTTDLEFLGMRYGALAGVPFSTGNLRPSGDDVESGFGLGDVLITPLALYGKSARFDYQVQLTVWTASGRFSPGAHDNRGTGFWALVYSLGGVFYPGGDREALEPVGRRAHRAEFRAGGFRHHAGRRYRRRLGRRADRACARACRIDIGVSGFAAWQVTTQTGGSAAADTSRYRYFGVGPEVSAVRYRAAVAASARALGVWRAQRRLRETTFGSFSTTAGEMMQERASD